MKRDAPIHQLRRVVHIEEVTGRHGGKGWVLTLECGHLAVRHRPSPDPVRVASMLVGVGVDRMQRLRAPERVRCWRCVLRAQNNA